MKIIEKQKEKTALSARVDFFEYLWEKSWTYIRTVVDVVREPVLVLDKSLHVIAANDPFYRTFQVEPSETEDRLVYELGNGQWNIPALKKLLEDILPENSFFKGFEVTHDFPYIGKKVMILNARRVFFEEDAFLKGYGPMEKYEHIILLAIEDVSEMMAVAETMASHTKEFEQKFIERTKKMEKRIETLRNEIEKLKKV